MHPRIGLLLGLLAAGAALAASVPPAHAASLPSLPICVTPSLCVCNPTQMPDCSACKNFPQRCNPCFYHRHCDPCYIPTGPKCDPCQSQQPPSYCAQCQGNPPAPECRNCSDWQYNPDCNPCTGRFEPNGNCPPECRQDPQPAGCHDPCFGNDPPDGCGEHDCAPLPRCLDDPVMASAVWVGGEPGWAAAAPAVSVGDAAAWPFGPWWAGPALPLA